MERDFLKKIGLDDEKIDQIMEEHGKTINSTKQSLEDIKQERDNLANEKEQLNQQIDDRDTKLAELSNNAGNAEQLKEQINALKEANEQAKEAHKQEIRKQTYDYELEKALLNAKARNPVAVKALLNQEAITLDDEKGLIGVSEQLENLKSEEGYLFEPDTNDGDYTPPTTNHLPGQQKKSNQPKDVDPYEQGRLKAQERFNQKQEGE